MKRGLGKLALLMTTAMAIAVVIAPNALAVEFHSEVASTVIEGHQVTQNVFKTAAGEVKCSVATFKGTASAATVEDLTISPTYSSCTAFGETAHVSTNSCQYTFTKPTSATTGPVDIVNCGGKSIEITVTVFGSSICTMTIGNQTGIGNVDYTNQGAGTSRDVLVTATNTGIDYFVHGGGGFCGQADILHTDGTYTGTVTTRGFTNGKQVGIWVT